VGKWLKGRRNALVDAAVVYAVSKWFIPEAVSLVACLASSPSGQAVLFLIAYVLLLAGSITLAIVLEDPEARSASTDDYDVVYVRHHWPPPYSFMLGSRGTWVKVRRSS
jgi:hypothetical protein